MSQELPPAPTGGTSLRVSAISRSATGRRLAGKTLVGKSLRRHWPLSLRTRLVGVLLILLALGSLAIGGVTHASLSARLNAQLDDDLRNASEQLQLQLRSQLNAENSDERDAPSGMPRGSLTGLIVNDEYLLRPAFQDPKTKSVKSVELKSSDATKIMDLAKTAPPSQYPGDKGPVEVDLSIGRYRVAYKSGTVTSAANGEVPATAVVGIPTTEATRTLATLDLSMVLVSLGGVLLIGTLGSVLISRSLRPLARVSAVASAVAEQPLERGEVDVDLRVAPEDSVPGTEVGNVGLALNNLLDNVDAALDVRAHSEARMRRFAADASHELRTPLAAIQGYSELLGATEALSDDGERSLDRVREQTRRMTELVENLLLLARLDESKPAASTTVDLSRLAADLTRDFSVAAPDHRWRFEPVGKQPVTVVGDEAQLNRVVQNLMSNARKHTSVGTHVTVQVGTTPDGARALLIVKDTGEGISPEFQDKVFDRFARADAARSGSAPTTGLGLSIVKAIVEAHGGTISVSSSPGDTQFAVRIPAVPAAPAAEAVQAARSEPADGTAADEDPQAPPGSGAPPGSLPTTH